MRRDQNIFVEFGEIR